MGISIVTWRYVRDTLVNWWARRLQNRTQAREDSNLDKLTSQSTFINNNSGSAISSILLGSDISNPNRSLVASEVPGLAGNEEGLGGLNGIYDSSQSQGYLALIPHLKPSEKCGGPFSYNWGGVLYMKCSPDGQHLVACYEQACVVFNIKLTQESLFILPHHALF